MAKELTPQEQIKALEDAAFERGKAETDKELRARFSEQLTAAKSDARKEGVEQERERIRAVEAVGLPGHEALIAELKFDGQTTGPEAAAKVIEAEQSKRARVLANLKDDAPAPAPDAAAPAPTDAAAEEAKLPVEERCKKQWDRDPDLREEFSGKLENFVAFTKADAAGRVQVLSKARQ